MSSGVALAGPVGPGRGSVRDALHVPLATTTPYPLSRGSWCRVVVCRGAIAVAITRSCNLSTLVSLALDLAASPATCLANAGQLPTHGAVGAVSEEHSARTSLQTVWTAQTLQNH